jgi:hypothetical protein
MVKEAIGFARAMMKYAIASSTEYQDRVTRHDSQIRLEGWGKAGAHFSRRMSYRSNRQQTNNHQQNAQFQIANNGKNTALPFIKQIHVMQFYMTKIFLSCYESACAS